MNDGCNTNTFLVDYLLLCFFIWFHKLILLLFVFYTSITNISIISGNDINRCYWISNKYIPTFQNRIIFHTHTTDLYVLARTPGDQLLGDVFAPADVRLVGPIGHFRVPLPVPVRRVRVHAGRRRVRHPRRGHQPDGFARGHRPRANGVRPVAGRRGPGTVGHLHRGRHADRLVVGLHAGQVRGGRARRVGHLFVHAIRLRTVRKRLNLQHADRQPASWSDRRGRNTGGSERFSDNEHRVQTTKRIYRDGSRW